MTTTAWSMERLGRMHDVMAAHVAQGAAPGVVTLVSRRGEVHVDVIGDMAFGGAPMRRDAIFRVTSMTKPITAVATLILLEECKLRLDEPVERLLPELANRRVLARIDGPIDETVPAKRSITVRDLLTFRLGFGQTKGPPDALPIQRAVRDRGVMTLGPPKPATRLAPDAWMRAFASLPLMFQPGERWAYNTGSYILGVLVARAAGQPLEAFLRQRIFEPLGMKDTGFTVPHAALDRFTTSYFPNAETGALEVHDDVATSQWREDPVFPDGAAGLVSTVDDYLAFGQMLLDHGAYPGGRILSRPSVEVMTTDQLTAEQKAISGFSPGYWDALGWGFGVSIVTRRDGIASIPGRYGWDGGYGTSWSSDPREGLVAILMSQRAGFPLMSPLYLDFWTSVYQAI